MDGVRHDYVYASGQLLRETYTESGTTYTLDFLYDQSGRPYMLYLTTTTASGTTSAPYYYILNLQGDVIHLVNTSGVAVACYTYDPYGAILTSAGSLADVNPLRYRGYYYDSDINLYYLQSRYYDPTLGRFITADSYTSTGQGFLGLNMFMYCGNCPVNKADSTGKFFEELWGYFVEAVEGAVSYFTTAGATALADGPELGPADIVGGAMAVGGIIYCLSSALYNTLTAPSQAVSLPRINTEEKEKTKTAQLERQYNYWAADLIGSEVVVSTPLTFVEASVRVSSGGNIMCRNQAAALAIVIVNNYRNAVGPEKGCGNNFYWHYHPTRNHKGYKSVHIWYYSEV